MFLGRVIGEVWASRKMKDLEGKRLQLLREIVPGLMHVAMLSNPANPFHVSSVRQAREAADALHMKIHLFPVRAEAELDPAFESMLRQHPDALLMLADRLFLHHRKRIADFCTQKQVPYYAVETTVPFDAAILDIFRRGGLVG